MAHAKFSPSGAHRWLLCPGSIAAESVFPDVAGYYAAEGTVAHTISERALIGNVPTSRFVGEVHEVEGHQIRVTDEMVNATQLYVDYCRAVPAVLRAYEVRVPLNIGIPDQFGTADAVLFWPDMRTIEVIDLKYGQGKEVSPVHNPQAALYGLGAMDEFAWVTDIDTVKLTIVQPRIKAEPDSWVVSADELLTWRRDTVIPAAAAADKPYAKRVAGKEQCGFCRARGNCKTRAQWALQQARAEFVEDFV